jgi:Asp-tRNA(Asn)/Glu-tRNA(Gln) amidotransferase A subunit family amidase
MDTLPSSDGDLTRRGLLSALAAMGVGTAVFQRAVAAQAEKAPTVTPEMIEQAEWVAGVKLAPEERKAVARAVNGHQNSFRALREVKLDNSVPMPLAFDPAPWLPPGEKTGTVEMTDNFAPKKPTSEDDLAFLPVHELAALLRTRAVSSMELTKLYLKRLQQYDPILHCVVSLTEKTALAQADLADREIAAGRYRGPLHGVPWGAKDLIAYPDYKTTWGAEPYKDQQLETKATVARKLEEAGAVLVAKLSLGALASGDKWFKERTRNPWSPDRGSSGSSAGSASSTAAGLVGFTLGSETLGSIVSPCRECGTTGLRPTFGRVSRAGCMALSWSMDKIGPIARCVEDCALVFAAIHGWDGLDASAVDRPFSWPLKRPLSSLKVGYFEGRTPEGEVKALKEMGVKLVPIKLPSKLPIGALTTILYTEAAALFDELTRKGEPKGIEGWINSFRAGQYIPAVEYLRANRVRALLMREMDEVMAQVDLYVGGGQQELVLTNLTGHPTVVQPSSFRKTPKAELPSSVTFTGRLYGETELLAVAHAYQQVTGAHLRRPPMEKLEKPPAAKELAK